MEHNWLTLFTDKTVIAVIGVVGISKTAVGVLEFKEFVPMLARVTGTACELNMNMIKMRYRIATY